jgi:hypothetical protein
MIARYRVTVSLLALLLIASAWAERRRDPLTQAEIDQLRDTALEPDERLKLFVTFARARLDAVEKVRTDPEVKDRVQATRDRLQDFLDVYDELDDNVDTFSDRRDDIRKSLKMIIEADTEFQAKLRALKDSVAAHKAEGKEYDLLLADVTEAVDGGAGDHRQLMTEQQEAAKQKKLVKPN